jgi:hypothetical protein
MQLSFILAPLDDAWAVALGTTNTWLPAKKAHGFVAFGIVY